MLACEICHKALKECCDLFHEAVDGNGKSVVICYECAEKYNLPFEEEEEQEEK